MSSMSIAQANAKLCMVTVVNVQIRPAEGMTGVQLSIVT